MAVAEGNAMNTGSPAERRLTDIEIVRREEDALSPRETAALAALLEEAFPGTFGGRIYFKQLPCFRFLALRAGAVVGQLGVAHRMMRLGDRPVRIFGLIDLCVAAALRGHGIGERLLQAAHAAGKAAGADFAVLFADDHRLYRKIGYVPGANPCTWLAIDEHASLGLKTATLEDELLACPLAVHPWPPTEPLDLLGYLF